MINVQKVKAMSKKSLFENDEVRDVLKLKKYCEDMPVWKDMAQSALAGFLLFLLLLLSAVLAAPDQFKGIIEGLGILWTTILAAALMAVWVAGYCVISDAVFRRRYARHKSRLCGYRCSVMRLDKMSREQAAASDVGNNG